MSNPEITITETCPFHLREMAETMQSESAERAMRFGTTPLKALWSNYRRSIICKSLFINGKLAAIFGISGIVFSEVGTPWICMTPETEQYPMRVAFRFKKELEQMSKMFPVLEDYLDENNEKGIRFMQLMGFNVSKNTIEVNGMKFRKAERR